MGTFFRADFVWAVLETRWAGAIFCPDGWAFQHLEKVSAKLLSTYPDIVRDLIGRQSGVYALYKKDRLYYVGLARKLSG